MEKRGGWRKEEGLERSERKGDGERKGWRE